MKDSDFCIDIYIALCEFAVLDKNNTNKTKSLEKNMKFKLMAATGLLALSSLSANAQPAQGDENTSMGFFITSSVLVMALI